MIINSNFANQALICHRIINKIDGSFLVKGDHNVFIDLPVSVEKILGKVNLIKNSNMEKYLKVPSKVMVYVLKLYRFFFRINSKSAIENQLKVGNKIGSYFYQKTSVEHVMERNNYAKDEQ